MGFLTIHRICGDLQGPTPSRVTLCEMLDQLTRTLAELGQRPTRILKTESWRAGGEKMLVRLRIECEGGDPARPLATWYQWQHPRWEWSLAMLPTVHCGGVERTHVERLMLVPPPPGGAGAHP